MNDMELSPLDFTENAMESFYGAVDDPYFRDADAQLIYTTMKDRIRAIPFGDYLKRYIYNRARLTGDLQEIPLATYQDIIVDSFIDNSTPAAFEPTTARLRTLAKNWLTQGTVKRNVVLLLGFGLDMPLKDINAFLTKALREQMLNPKDPLEVICWYCYANHYGFGRFELLWKQFQALPADDSADEDDLWEEHTVGVRSRMSSMANDAALLEHLALLKRPYNGSRQSVTARSAFDRLYARAREIAADLLNAAESDSQAIKAGRLRAQLAASDRLYDYQKAERVSASGRPKLIRPEDVTPGDIEKIICAAIPMNKQGNMIAAKASELNAQFSGKRFNRQHTAEVLAGKAWIDRFDLITLNFFVHAGDPGLNPLALRRYNDFIESTNHILEDCGMNPLYIANPYECFILMCMVSDDPLGTYADVLELSYAGSKQDE